MNGPLRILSLLASGMCLPVLAQTVFTPGTAIPAFGDYTYSWYQRQGSPAAPIDTNATTGTWDFSALNFTGATEYSVTIAPSSSTPHAALAPGADIAWIYRGNDRDDYTYFKNGPDSLLATLEVVDMVGEPPYPDGVCEQVRFIYPVQVGDVFTEQENVDCNPTNIWRRKVIAVGTLVTSIGTFEDAVLVKHSGTSDESSFLRYLWFLPGNALDPFASHSPGDIPDFRMRVLAPVVGIEEASGISTLVLSPNPATDHITLQSRDGMPLGEVRIHAADGRVVKQFGMPHQDRLEIDMTDLPAGLYTLTAQNHALRSAMRLVKH